MPTGYTQGILDGSTKTFNDFAKLCMRAFGATIHMRDDSLDAEYVPDKPSEYHLKAIEQALQLLDDSKNLSDEEIIARRKANLEESKTYHLQSIEKAKEGLLKLTDFLEKAKEYEPPTYDHVGIKKFMIEQITGTIDWDTKTKYHDEALEKINAELSNLNAGDIRNGMKATAIKDLAYHETEHQKDIERIESRNKWVEDYINSLK